MCYFVALGVPQSERAALTRFEPRTYGLSPVENVNVLSFFPATDAVSWIINAQCSCDLFAVRRPALDERLDRAKFERRGWSAAKIERALAQRRGHVQPMKEEARAFRERLRALIEELGAVRLHAHMYRGDQSTEHVPDPARLEWSLAEFESYGGAWPEDTLLTLKAT